MNGMPTEKPAPSDADMSGLGAAPFMMPPTAMGGVQGGGISPRDIFHIIRKRLWLILLSLVFFTTVAGFGSYYWLKTAPSYVTHAAMQVNTPPRTDREFGSPEEQIPAYMPQLMETHAEYMLRHDVLEAVAMDEEVRNTAWAKKEALGQLEERLEQALRVSPKTKTRILVVSGTTNSKNDSAIIANALCSAYEGIAYTRAKRRHEEYGKTLNERITDLKEELEVVRAEIETLTRGSQAADLTERNSTKKQELEVQNRQAIQFKSELIRAQGFLDRLRAAEEAGTLMDMPQVIAALYQDPEYASLRQRQEQQEANLRQLQRRYGPQHAMVLEAEGQLSTVLAQLGTVEEAGVGAFMARYQSEVDSLKAQQGVLEETIDQTKRELKDLYVTLIKLQQQRKIESEKIQGIQRLELSRQAHMFRVRLLAPVEFYSKAPPARRRSAPNIPMMIVGGVVVGIMVGLALTVLLEIMDTSIKRPSDIKRRVDVPLLGVVPHTRDLEEEIDDPRLALSVFPDSPLGEAFRQIRTRVLFSGPADQQRVLMVTSPLPEDGRTTVTVNLGLTMAQSGSKVLLIDANFRQPILHELFEGDDLTGLSSALVEQGQWQDMLLTPSENLHVLPAGPLPPNPAELLASPQMRSLLLAASETYDRVLIDSGPCLVVTDPLVMASMVDGVILTFRAGANTHGVASRAKNVLFDARAHLVGAVLNSVRVMAGGYMRKNYDAFYDYRERQLPA
jgi:polysaccharide biosynthesis transport protein